MYKGLSINWNCSTSFLL